MKLGHCLDDAPARDNLAAANVRQSLGDAAPRDRSRAATHTGLRDAAIRDRGGNPPPQFPIDNPNPPDPEPMSRYTVGYLTGYRSGLGYAISLIAPLVEDDPENAVPAIREALRTLAEQMPASGSQLAG